MPVLPWKTPAIRYRYFVWEGDACRVHCDPSGDLVGEIYVASTGKLAETCATTIMQSSREIGLAEFEDIIERRSELYLLQQARLAPARVGMSRPAIIMGRKDGAN